MHDLPAQPGTACHVFPMVSGILLQRRREGVPALAAQPPLDLDLPERKVVLSDAGKVLSVNRWWMGDLQFCE